MARPNDRRTLRTQAALRSALIDLLTEKSYDAITVKEITDRANIGRSTFYSHCTGKEDLLRRNLQQVRFEVVEHQRLHQAAMVNGPQAVLTFSLPVLEHLMTHRELYPSLARGRGGDIFLGCLREIVTDLAAEDFRKLGEDGLQKQVVTEYVVGAFMAVVKWWLGRKYAVGPTELDAIFQTLAIKGLNGLRE